MEEILRSIIHGCNLAKVLESKVSDLATYQPIELIESCDEIMKAFNSSKLMLLSHVCGKGHDESEAETQRIPETARQDVSLMLQRQRQSSECTREMMDLIMLHSRFLATGKGVSDAACTGTSDVHELLDIDRKDGEGSSRPAKGVLGGGEVQPMDVITTESTSSGRSIATPQRQPRRRNDSTDKRTVQVPAPRIGNPDIPPDDGYTWRKYGQKEILGSRFPRGYYRCTHQRLYQCPAKKQVQRMDNDPHMFQVTYRGDHTCHMSSTAPLAPPPQELLTQEMMTSQQAITAMPPPLSNQQSAVLLQSTPSSSLSVSLSQWLSMDIKPSGESSGNVFMDMYRNVGGHTRTSGSRGGAGLSSYNPYGREADYQPVVDLADAMFNSGSSSNNSMELIFSGMEDKWTDTGGTKKN